jgi:ABC-type phosphate/phosphonate transport system ATPase subunit
VEDRSSESQLRARWREIPKLFLPMSPLQHWILTGKNVMEMMSELAHKRGRAVVLVTHDSRVLSFADRIVKIEDGAIARPEALRREPVPAGMLTHTFSQSTLNID